jgi:hypothetical protein
MDQVKIARDPRLEMYQVRIARDQVSIAIDPILEMDQVRIGRDDRF